MITERQVAQFVDEGFLLLPDLLIEEIGALRAEADALAGDRSPLCFHQPHRVRPLLRRSMAHPALCQVLTRIVGAHLAHWDGSVKSMQSMLFIKGPGKPGQAWHQDELHIPTRDRSLCGAWIALDDATKDNGCLSVLPGSHRTGYLYPFRKHTNPEFDGASESYGFDDQGEVLVEMRAGSVLFFNGYLLHRSKKNVSRHPRRALVMHYMNAWSLLPWDQEPHVRLGTDSRIATADNRNVVPVAGVDPYAWKGYEAGGDILERTERGLSVWREGCDDSPP